MRSLRTLREIKNIYAFFEDMRLMRYELLIINFGVCGVVYV